MWQFTINDIGLEAVDRIGLAEGSAIDWPSARKRQRADHHRAIGTEGEDNVIPGGSGRRAQPLLVTGLCESPESTQLGTQNRPIDRP
jgi:hypothetical protein